MSILHNTDYRYSFMEFHDFSKENMEHFFNTFGLPETVIEIGVFTGYFTVNLTAIVAPQRPTYKHYAIDPFEIYPEFPGDEISKAYTDFKNNLNVCPYSKHIEFMHKRSYDALIDLTLRGVKADLIYVDGNHTAPGVLQDMVLGFELLKPGAIMLCDDSTSWGHDKKLTDTPRLGVDSFIQCNWDRLHVLNLPNSYQTAIYKKNNA